MKAIDPSVLGEFWPAEGDVLSYYDGPRLFVCRAGDRLYYVHQCDEGNVGDDHTFEQWLVRPSSPDELQAIKANTLPIRDFLLSGPRLYLVETVDMDEVRWAFILERADIEEDWLPKAGVFLSRL